MNALHSEHGEDWGRRERANRHNFMIYEPRHEGAYIAELEPMTGTLEIMHEIDKAWNNRNWDAYGSLIADNLVAFAYSETSHHGKAAHIAKAIEFCSNFPDAKVDCNNYLEIFASHDGSRSGSAARLTGTDRRTGRAFDVTFAVFYTWSHGQVVAQRVYLDTDTMRRQLSD